MTTHSRPVPRLQTLTEFLQCRLVIRNLSFDQHIVLFVVHGVLKEVRTNTFVVPPGLSHLSVQASLETHAESSRLRCTTWSRRQSSL